MAVQAYTGTGREPPAATQKQSRSKLVCRRDIHPSTWSMAAYIYRTIDRDARRQSPSVHRPRRLPGPTRLRRQCHHQPPTSGLFNTSRRRSSWRAAVLYARGTGDGRLNVGAHCHSEALAGRWINQPAATPKARAQIATPPVSKSLTRSEMCPQEGSVRALAASSSQTTDGTPPSIGKYPELSRIGDVGRAQVTGISLLTV